MGDQKSTITPESSSFRYHRKRKSNKEFQPKIRLSRKKNLQSAFPTHPKMGWKLIFQLDFGCSRNLRWKITFQLPWNTSLNSVIKLWFREYLNLDNKVCWKENIKNKFLFSFFWCQNHDFQLSFNSSLENLILGNVEMSRDTANQLF